MEQPLVSILIAVYNTGEYLRPSVKSILSQTYSNLEILIIDDGSTDGCMSSIEDLRDCRIRILKQANSGKASVLNFGLRELTGEFYAIHDSDDISHPNRIEFQLKCMLGNPQIAGVFTGYNIIMNEQRLAPKFCAKNIEQCRRDIAKYQMPSHDPTAMYRMSMVRNFQYDPNLKVGEGLDYILRIGELYPMIVLGQCLYSYRFRPGSLTKQNAAQRNQIVREVLKNACHRRGQNYFEQIFEPPSSSNLFSHRSKENNIIAHFMDSVIDLKNIQKNREALNTAIECVKLHPLDPYYYKPLVYCIVPKSIIDFYRQRKNKYLTSKINSAA